MCSSSQEPLTESRSHACLKDRLNGATRSHSAVTTTTSFLVGKTISQLSGTLAHSPTRSSLCWTYLLDNRTGLQTHNSSNINFLLAAVSADITHKTPTGHNHRV